MGFNDKITEVVTTLREAAFLNAFLSTLIFFLLVYHLLSLINLFPYILAGAFSVFFLTTNWIRKSEFYTAQLVEKKFPFLKDKLTTAKDTLKTDNLVVEKLRVDVAKRLRKVDSSSFFTMGRTYLKIIIILALSFSMLLTSANDIMLFDTEKALSEIDLSGSKEIFSGGTPTESNYSEGEGLSFEVAKVVDLDDITDTEEKDFKKEAFSYDIESIGAEEYNDPITEEEKDVVKNYFNNIGD